MRKLILYMHVSLDGFVQGEHDWDIGWIIHDEEMERYADENFKTVDTVLWGRGTYLGMQRHWTTVPDNPDASEHERAHAAWLNRTQKVVFSTTLESVDWNNSILIRENIAEEVQKLKNQDGQDMMIIGSPRVAHHLMQHHLIDEFRLNVNPVILGKGLSLFKDVQKPIPLELVQNQTFRSGVIGLIYRLKKEPQR
jgi:dihydrofolate reductase